MGAAKTVPRPGHGQGMRRTTMRTMRMEPMRETRTRTMKTTRRRKRTTPCWASAPRT